MPRTKFHLKILPLVPLSLILGFLVVVSIPRLNLPFIDTRLHWYFENALFLHMSVHSNDKTISDSRKIFGVSRYDYNQSLEPVRVQFYSHHGILGPAALLQFARLVGFHEYTPRLFSLLLSLLSATFLFFTIRTVLNSTYLAFVLTLTYFTMPLQLMYMDQMKYSNTETVVFFGLLFSYSRLNTWKYATIAFLLCLLLLFHTDYPIFLPALFIAGYMLIPNEPFHEKSSRWFLAMVPISIVLGLLTAGLVQFSLGFTPGKMAEMASFRTGWDQPGLTVGTWIERQWNFLKYNFAAVHLLFGGMCLFWITTRPSLLKNFWIFSGVGTLFSTILYLAIFANQSFVHHFLQWHLAAAYILMLIGMAQVHEWKIRFHKKWFLGFLLIPLFLLSFYQDYALYKQCRAPEFGNYQDLKVIQAIDKRIRYFENGASGPPDWWSGPGIMLYKDPIFNGRKGPMPQPISERISNLSEQDLLVSMDNRRAVAFVHQFLKARYPNLTLESVQRSPSFIYFRCVAGRAR